MKKDNTEILPKGVDIKPELERLYKEGKYEQLVAKAYEAIENGDDRGPIYWYLAAGYNLLKDYKASIQVGEMGIAKYPEHRGILEWLIKTHFAYDKNYTQIVKYLDIMALTKEDGDSQYQDYQIYRLRCELGINGCSEKAMEMAKKSIKDYGLVPGHERSVAEAYIVYAEDCLTTHQESGEKYPKNKDSFKKLYEARMAAATLSQEEVFQNLAVEAKEFNKLKVISYRWTFVEVVFGVQALICLYFAVINLSLDALVMALFYASVFYIGRNKGVLREWQIMKYNITTKGKLIPTDEERVVNRANEREKMKKAAVAGLVLSLIFSMFNNNNRD